jgi:hypothetical protein
MYTIQYLKKKLCFFVWFLLAFQIGELFLPLPALGHLGVRWGEHCIESCSDGFLL